MRIIAGSERSRLLTAPSGRDTRPTQDRVREAVFSMLSSRIDFEGQRVLDLFAGSGAMAFEALSRGAAFADLVDNAQSAVKAIQTNMASLRYEHKACVYPLCWTRALDTLPGGYGLVFVDPPYAVSAVPAVQAIAERGLLMPGAIVVIEHGRGAPPELPERFIPLTTRAYGVSAIAMFEWE